MQTEKILWTHKLEQHEPTTRLQVQVYFDNHTEVILIHMFEFLELVFFIVSKRYVFRLSLRDNLIKNQIWYEASGQWGRVSLCSLSESAPPKGLGGQITPKSGIFFKNLLVRNCQAECTEIDMGASGACLDVKLCSTWPLAPGKGGSGGIPQFWQRTPRRRRLPSYPSD